MENDDFEAQILESSDFLDALEKKASKTSATIANSLISAPKLETAHMVAPSNFNFPFLPYSIQADFMTKLFETIESGHVGIFESPTGTGKSLSLLCGSLTWLRMDEERRRKEFENLMKEQENTGKDDDWIEAFVQKEEILSKNGEFLNRQRQLENRDKELLQWKRDYKSLNYRLGLQKRKSIGFGSKLRSGDSEESGEESKEIEPDEELILEDYESDNDSKTSVAKFGDEEETVDSPKIIYCSRTHSQLAQFLNEIKKTSFADNIRVVTLGSRQNFCINETVRKGNHVSLINDRCLQLQKEKAEKVPPGKKDKPDGGSSDRRSKKGCPYYKRGPVEELAKSILMNGVRDIEDLISESKESKACPYYASRQAIAAANLVLAPYQILMHKPTREACGLKLSGNVLVIDEAHNLLDVISSIHSVEVNAGELSSARSDIVGYLLRYSKRLNAKNLMYIRQLDVVVDGLEKSLKKCTEERVFTLTDFVFLAGIDTVNMFKLVRYMEASRISQKLNFYSRRLSQQADAASGAKSTLKFDQSSKFHTVESFLRCLVQRVEDGRIIVSNSKLKFVHLNPAVFFKDLLTSFRSVILAGGTMEPVSDLIDQLFTPCGIMSPSIDRFSCGHIVDDDNLMPLILDRGPAGVQFDFTFANRNNEAIIRELGRLLANLSNVVPGGIVCFFQSYDYEASIYERWSSWGVLQAIEKKKKIYREPTKASDVNGVLENFAKSAKGSSGALMMAVVGGKLSEGINFADDLGRMVIMVGLPFPNAHSVELKEKMRFLCDRSGDRGRGNEYYENLCMKAVNQSIGRVIRHRHDYAAILLLDKGYSRQGIQKKLPSWIKNLIISSDSFGSSFGKIKQFFTRLSLKYNKE